MTPAIRPLRSNPMLEELRNKITHIADTRLVPGWRKGYKWFSMQAMGINAVFLLTWAAMPDDLKSALPSWLAPLMAVFVLAAGMAGRMTHQPGVETK